MHTMVNTLQIQHKFNISRQSLYTWIKNNELKVNKFHNRYIWDSGSILGIKHLIIKHRKAFHKTNNLFHINNRRFLGSKERLLPFINRVVNNHTKNIKSVGDIFAGTGVVSNMFLSEGKEVVINDILHSNYFIYKAFFGDQQYSKFKIKRFLSTFNGFKHFKYNYLARQYGNKYFTNKNASKIGQARQLLENKKSYLNQREFSILLTSILYAADKVANTVGHYDSYRLKMTNVKPVYFKMLKINNYHKAKIYEEDANELVKHFRSDLVYIDTPYNSRQYADSYHVLENITDWNKPKLYGKARKPKQIKDRRSQYNLVSAPRAFDDLITHIKSKYILVSFNNMANKGVGRSNSKISNNDIINTLSKRGDVKIFSHYFNPFNSGKTHLKNHKELLYLVKVTK